MHLGFYAGLEYPYSLERDVPMTAKSDSERFQSGAEKYAAYLETPEGRLRSDLAFANLQEFLPQRAKEPLSALDIGCGTGATAVRLARLGIRVALLDSSPAMLEIAKDAAREAGVTDKVVLQHGDATQLANLFEARSFDVVLCHNVLEYCDDAVAVLRGAARVLRDSSAILSILVRNQAGEVLKAVTQTGDLAAVENTLTAETARESLYGSTVRLFKPKSLQEMLKAASLTMIAARGIRAMADYLPQKVSRIEQYEKIFELERKLSVRPEFTAVARYIHYFARCASPAMEAGL
jgi:S-adenosylmethionine-dependent methyltransferase